MLNCGNSMTLLSTVLEKWSTDTRTNIWHSIVSLQSNHEADNFS